MKKLLTYSCAVFTACALHADSTWLATLDLENIQSLQTGIEAFINASGIPVKSEDITGMVTAAFGDTFLSSLDTAISFKDPIRIFLTENSAKPLSAGGEPEVILAMTLPAAAKALQDKLAQVYGARSEADNIITFTTPKGDSPFPKNMLLSVADRKAILTTSKDAFTWLQQQKKFDGLLPAAGNQTLKVCLNASRLAGMMPQMPVGQPNPLAAILGDLDTLSIGITPNAQALTLSYGLKAKADSPLATFLSAFGHPDAALWNGLPENTLLAYVGTQGKYAAAKKFTEAYLQQPVPDNPVMSKLLDALSSEVVRYLAPTKDNKSLRLIDIDPIKDAAVIKEIIKTLDQTEVAPGVKYKKEEGRQIGEQAIERYSIVFDVNAMMQARGGANAGANAAAANAVNMAMNPAGIALSLFAKSIVIEMTVKDNYLLSSIGPTGATDDWLPVLPFPTPTAATLDKKLAAQDPAAKALLGAGELRILPLFKQIVSMLPNAKPEHVNLFTAKTDPIQFWATRTADNTTISTVRIPVNEIAAIVKITETGETALQEIMFAIFASQLLTPAMPPAAVPPPNF